MYSTNIYFKKVLAHTFVILTVYTVSLSFKKSHCMKFINLILILFLVVASPSTQFVFAQKTSGSLLDGLSDSSDETVYAKYSFKTDRVINLHSLETTAEGVMDVKISHRFGPVDNGFYDLFGLDAATQRIGCIDFSVETWS